MQRRDESPGGYHHLRVGRHHDRAKTHGAGIAQHPRAASQSKNLYCSASKEASVCKGGYKRDKTEMRGDRAEPSDFHLYLNTVAGGLDCRNQAVSGFSFVVKINAVPVIKTIGCAAPARATAWPARCPLPPSAQSAPPISGRTAQRRG